MPDLHPDLAAYTDAPPPEEGVAGTPEQLLAHLLTADPHASVNLLGALLTQADRGTRCTLLDHTGRLGHLEERLAAADRRYTDLLVTLIATAASNPATASDALAEHTATTPPPDPAAPAHILGPVILSAHKDPGRPLLTGCGLPVADDTVMAVTARAITCPGCAEAWAAPHPTPPKDTP